MAGRASFKTVDRGANAMVRRVNQDVGLKVRVGVFSSEPHGDSGLSVADVATIHEFGLGVPRRSFIRGWYDEDSAKLQKFITALEQRVLLGQITQAQAEAQLGLLCVGRIQRRIVDGIPPALAQSTIDKKGSSTPLVDTGQLKASITAEGSK